MSNNRHCFATTLDGFIQVFEDSGKYNNRAFGFTIPQENIAAMEDEREELLKWAASKTANPKRVEVALTKWDESGNVRYSYGGDTKRLEPVFVDSDGEPVSKDILKSVRAGTKVNVIVQQSPYLYGNKIGTKFQVVGVQIVELVTGSGAVDSGSLSTEEVASMFGKVDGFKASEPAVRAETQPERSLTTAGYNF